MTLALLFWVLMLLWLVLGSIVVLPTARNDWKTAGVSLLPFLLFLILGWAVLGAPIK